MKITVKVTKEVLRRTMYCGVESCDNINQNCAISFAIRDIMPKAVVERGGIYPFPIFNENGEYQHLQTISTETISIPQEAVNFIRIFDGLYDTPKQRLGMQPIEFEIDIPDTIIDLINISDIHNSKTLEVVCA